MARYWLSGFIAHRIGETFPWGTLVVNVSGAFIIGIVFGLAAPLPEGLPNTEIRYLLVIGFLGSYTTVSSFSLQTLTLAQNRQWSRAAANVFFTTGACLFTVWLGYELVVAGVRWLT